MVRPLAEAPSRQPPRQSEHPEPPERGLEALRLLFQYHLSQEVTRIYLLKGEERVLLGTLPYLGHTAGGSRVFLLMANLLEALGELERHRLLFEEEYV